MDLPIKLTSKSEKILNPYTKSMRLTMGSLSRPVPSPAWGIDPGVNFGLTILDHTKAYIFHGSLMSDSVPGRQGLIAYMFLNEVIRKYAERKFKIVIEGAAYGAPFRQVELSEIRTGFYLAASLSSIFNDIQIKPPASIRKKVFGGGKVQAMDEFPTLNHNAADSLAIAYYAATSYEKGDVYAIATR